MMSVEGEMRGSGRARELKHFVGSQLSSSLASGLGWVVMTGLILVGVHYATAIAVEAVLGAATDFFVKRRFVFRTRHAPVDRQMVRYAVTSLLSLALNEGTANILVERVRMHPAPGALAAALVVGLLWNYPMHRFFVFRHPTPVSR
jgi:putative flippase GtrA